MSDDNERSNPLAGIYGLGLIGCTALLYSQDGFWWAFAKSLIWPIYVGVFIAERFK